MTSRRDRYDMTQIDGGVSLLWDNAFMMQRLLEDIVQLGNDCTERRMKKLLARNTQLIVGLAALCFFAGFVSQLLFFSRRHDSLPDGLRARVELDHPSQLGMDKAKPEPAGATAIVAGIDKAPVAAVPMLPSGSSAQVNSVTAPSVKCNHRDNSTSVEGMTQTQLMISRTKDDAVPSIVLAWRSAKLDWHQLLPKHLSKWERYGLPSPGKGLRLLVSKETQVTNFLTRFHESGLSAMYGHQHGSMLSYSGCDTFLSPCMVHTDQSCNEDDLCMWSSSQSLCVDRDKTRPSTATDTCPNPVRLSGEQGTIVKTQVQPSQCDFFVNQPTMFITVDSESQSMFYHWWASFCHLTQYWTNELGSSRKVHIFVKEINDPSFFQFFGLLTDVCWRRATPLFLHIPKGACFCKVHDFDAQQSRNEPDKAVAQILHFLHLEATLPPTDRVKVGLISRRRKRFILNEYELVAAVEALGFECVLLPFETMTLYEQMHELRSLDVMIGIHGSGLDNAVFLHPGSVMVQLLPYKNDHRCTFPSTAEQAGVVYQEWQLQDESKTVLHWDLFEQANAERLKADGPARILQQGQAGSDLRETLMFWINQDIIVPLPEWETIVRRAVGASNAPKRGLGVGGR